MQSETEQGNTKCKSLNEPEHQGDFAYLLRTNGTFQLNLKQESCSDSVAMDAQNEVIHGINVVELLLYFNVAREGLHWVAIFLFILTPVIGFGFLIYMELNIHLNRK